jgi:hypothetical protein
MRAKPGTLSVSIETSDHQAEIRGGPGVQSVVPLRALATAAVLIVLAGCSKKEPELVEDMSTVYPLRQLTNDSELIAEGSLVSFDARSRKAVLRLRDAIQGRLQTAEVELDFTGGAPVPTESLLRHLVPGMPIVWYSSGGCAMVYLNRFFVLCYGDPATGKWAYTYVEIHANGTYNGPAADLAPLMRDIVSGRLPAPPPDDRLKPVTIADVRALPVWGEPIDEEYLPRCFRRGKPPPIELRTPEDPAGLVAGLRAVTYGGPWVEPPNFDQYDVLEKGVADSLTLADFPTKGTLRVRFHGYLDVPKDGVYVFTLAGDARSTFSLRIGSTDVVSFRASTRDQAGDIALKAGKHALRLSCSTYEGDRGLQVLWSGPGFSRRPIPANACFRDP